MKIGLIIDHPHRDLNGYLLLSNQLLKSFDEVILIPMYHVYEIFLLDIDFFIIHNLRPANVKLAILLKKLNKTIFVIDNEGVPFGWIKGNDHIKTLTNSIIHNLELVDKYFVWGGYIKNIFLSNKIENNKIKDIIITGNQRFDLFTKRFNFLNKPRKTEKKVIIINTSSPQTNPLYASKAAGREALKVVYQYSNNSEKKINLNIRNNIYITNNFIKMIKKIVSDFKNYKIIINPHPFEDVQLYKSNFGIYKNVLILNKNFYTPRLYNNYDFIVQYNSTTCAEHLLQGKKALSVNFVDKNNILNKFYRKFTIQFNSYKKIKYFLEKYSNKKIININSKEIKYLDYLYFNTDGKSHKRIYENLINFSNKIKLKKNNYNLKIKILLIYFFYLDKRFFINPLFYKSIIKFLLIALINSKNFYLLKSFFFFNYKEKTIKMNYLKVFFSRLDNKKILISYKKSALLSFFFGKLSSISLKK
jgi:surface carbohydrate biosynthesis protein